MALLNEEISRRNFFRSASTFAGAAIVPGLNQQELASEGFDETAYFKEPSVNLPVKGDVDVLVCGAGPAGVAAAITAARSGAKTQLIELAGCLGGVWTAGLLTWIFDFDKPGITREIVSKLDERNARSKYGNEPAKNFVYAPEAMKILLEEMCAEAGVEFVLHTRVAAAYKDNKRLTTVVTESKSGRHAWRAKVFIDATGDGDVGAFAGNGWETGFATDQECPCQPLTLNALAIVKDASAIRDYISFYEFKDESGELKFGTHHGQASARLMKEINRAGLKPSYGRPTIFQISGNLVMLMLNHEYNVRAFNADEVSQATIRARAEIDRIVRGLNSLGGVWEGMQIAYSAEQIGIRDGRRLHGRYRVTKKDVLTGSKHADGVTNPTFNADIHSADLDNNHSGGPIQIFKVAPYVIPLRSLIARDVDGLMMAGRCISGDSTAHASYRVTGNAVAMGEAAGCVAAIAAKSKRMPHDVNWKEAEDFLTKLGMRE
ncbi:FAD-dependent oxidoreductase [Dyadobacter sp. CY323]|uniref:FAD-dependent oxidoreductase n=1 Tax=Dyadobacter sp. CY323 TaxID=2907302 RepID=UPI001F2A7BAD|nr:FAD-dependent oxidoreductase [Dyadobacter sp. CY323]MCE6991096.1 FAD-dependent oxidoreductase [Dyadobacter sp. CY323]